MGRMISVVIPTMWRANDFLFRMLEPIQNSKSVSEMIIIDNDHQRAPKNFLSNFPKVKRHIMEKNIYYNPSMNLGVELANEEIVCSLNDDCIFNANVFDFVSENMDKDAGLLLVHPELFNREKPVDEPMNISESVKLKDGSAAIYFVNKKTFHPIPKEFKHHFGDSFQYDMQKKLGRKNYVIDNFFLWTPMRVTTHQVPEVAQIIANDWAIHEEVFRSYGLM
jgi:glycosyltransferase involved in cell wall biosynthesis